MNVDFSKSSYAPLLEAASADSVCENIFRSLYKEAETNATQCREGKSVYGDEKLITLHTLGYCQSFVKKVYTSPLEERLKQVFNS